MKTISISNLPSLEVKVAIIPSSVEERGEKAGLGLDGSKRAQAVPRQVGHFIKLKIVRVKAEETY